MICYRDMTFCSAPCKTNLCSRNMTQATQEAADKWWGGKPGEAPIALADLSIGCQFYSPKDQPK